MAETRITSGDTPNADQQTAPMQPALPPPLTEAQILAVHVGELKPLTQPIQLVGYDPTWPHLFAREAERVCAALGDRVLLLEHVGSTSVPGLAAKPKIDMLLVVDDAADEGAYVPALEAAGYRLHVREPDWYEHRLFKGPDTDINLHVFTVGCEEIDRMLCFRNWLRAHDADRASTSARNRISPGVTGSTRKTMPMPRHLSSAKFWPAPKQPPATSYQASATNYQPFAEQFPLVRL